MPIINNKHVPYTKENIAMARKMAQQKTAKVYEPPSREQVIMDLHRKGLNKKIPTIQRYPTYAKSGKGNTA